jgi:hypothetical protein
VIEIVDKEALGFYPYQCAFKRISTGFGALAQLGERLHGMEEVESSILLRSTKSRINLGIA